MTAIAAVLREHAVPRSLPEEIHDEADERTDPLADAFPTSPPDLPLDPLTELLMLAKDVPWRRAPRAPPPPDPTA
jgi:hypothetical protein